MFLAINAYRSNVGVGMVSQDANLDAAAQAHALYNQVNFNSGVLQGLTHTEDAANPSFYEATPYQRARKAGTAVNLWVSEVVAASYSPANNRTSDGDDCAGQWLNSVYHLQSATDNSTSVGFGYVAPVSVQKALFYCVANFGAVSSPAPEGPASYNATPYDGGQQIAAGAIVHAPFANESNVPLAMEPESPNPAPDVAAPGRPIMVRVNAQKGNILTVNSFQLADAAGAVVPARVIVAPSAVAGSKAAATADVNDYLSAGVAFLLPLAPLAANTVYTVTFTGARDSVAMAATWQFTTATK
ncbi:CAP domain-containing protein [Caballeronia sp. LjRoot34]